MPFHILNENSIGIRRLFFTVSFALLLLLVPYVIWFGIIPEWYPCKRYLSNLPMLALLVTPSILPGKWGKTWLFVVYALCVPLGIAETLHLVIFETNIASESLYAFFETSNIEAGEAICSYANVKIVLSVACCIIVPLIPLYFLLQMHFVWHTKSAIVLLFFALVFVFCVPGVFRLSLMGRVVASWQEYQEYNETMKEYSHSSTKHVVVPATDQSPDSNQTVVVVIGESATRHHLALYGYHRPTTPVLSAKQDELLVFDNIISRHGFTVANITAMLTVPLGKDGGDAPAIELFRNAGFQTYWLSNHNTFQAGKGLFHLLYAADQVIPVNPDGDLGVPRRYDERLLPVLDSILKEQADSKKIIFINIMGSHFKYSTRYPEQWDYFTITDDIPDAPWRDDGAKAIINAYDNSIRYTDYILGEIIDRIDDTPNAALLYLSDHGQEVYDTQKHMGPGPTLTSPYFVDIPFVIWLSQSLRQTRPYDVARWQTYTKRPGVSDCLPSVLAELCNIQYADPLLSHNVLSPDFIASDRVVLGASYDKQFGTDIQAAE